MKILAQVAYDGSKYHGFALQKNVRTILGQLYKALRKFGTFKVDYLSRTDSGVNAVSQHIIISTENNDDRSLPYYLNSQLVPCIRIHKYTYLNEDFSLRKNVIFKEYLYVAPDLGEDLNKLRWICDFISSNSHNYSSLIKRQKSMDFDANMRIYVSFRKEGSFQLFTFRNRSFLWEQIRRIVTFIKSYGLNRLKKAEVFDILKGHALPQGIAPAPAEGLILWRVKLNKFFRWINIHPEEIIRRWILSRGKYGCILNRRFWTFPRRRMIRDG